jgi:hypothetical protein
MLPVSKNLLLAILLLEACPNFNVHAQAQQRRRLWLYWTLYFVKSTCFIVLCIAPPPHPLNPSTVHSELVAPLFLVFSSLWLLR